MDNSDPVTDANIQAEVSFFCSYFYRLAIFTFPFLRFYVIIFTRCLCVNTLKSITTMFLQVAFWNNILISCNYVFALWTQILWSAHSDRAGRKIGLLVGGTGSLFRPLISMYSIGSLGSGC